VPKIAGGRCGLPDCHSGARQAILVGENCVSAAETVQLDFQINLARKFLVMRANFSLAASAFACATLTLLAACKPAEAPPALEVRPVRTMTIEQRAGADTIGITGTVQAQTEVNLAFRIDGKLVERNVNVGDTVRSGQPVARLDPQNEDSSNHRSSRHNRRLLSARIG
jgi:multidrug efflux pump subunit AcrA (membrane-fusion protein)